MSSFGICELRSAEVTGSEALNRESLRRLGGQTRQVPGLTGASRVHRRPLSVLVIDDEQDTTDGLVRQIAHWGHAVELAYDGATALRVAAIQHPDVVLLDIGMPFLDGFHVARQLRRDFGKQDCLIIAISGWADEQPRRQQCTEADIDLLLVKPVDPAVIETLLMLESERVNRLARIRPEASDRWAASISSRAATTRGLLKLAPVRLPH